MEQYLNVLVAWRTSFPMEQNMNSPHQIQEKTLPPQTNATIFGMSFHQHFQPVEHCSLPFHKL